MTKSNLPVVYTDDKGQHIVMSTGGEDIQGIIFTRVHDENKEATTVLVKLYCRLAKGRKEALEMFDKHNT